MELCPKHERVRFTLYVFIWVDACVVAQQDHQHTGDQPRKYGQTCLRRASFQRYHLASTSQSNELVLSYIHWGSACISTRADGLGMMMCSRTDDQIRHSQGNVILMRQTPSPHEIVSAPMNALL